VKRGGKISSHFIKFLQENPAVEFNANLTVLSTQFCVFVRILSSRKLSAVKDDIFWRKVGLKILFLTAQMCTSINENRAPSQRRCWFKMSGKKWF
jgi:hypothetical protein